MEPLPHPGSAKRDKVPGKTAKGARCLVDGCTADLNKCSAYHRKHKVCKEHCKAPMVRIGGVEQRFCQHCSRFHSLDEFDEGKKSCRRRYQGHNKMRQNISSKLSSENMSPREGASLDLTMRGKDKATYDTNTMPNRFHFNFENLMAFENWMPGRNSSSIQGLSKSLQTKMRSLCAKVRDVEEEIKIAQLHGKRKRKRELENWLVDVQNIEKEHDKILVNEPQMQRGQAEELSLKLDNLLGRRQQLGGLVVDAYDIRGEPSLTRMFMGEEIQKNLEQTMQLFLVDKVPSVGIYGMAGVGKTVLAKQIHSRLLEINQLCVVWITVSQGLTTWRMQDEISEVIGLDLLDEYDEDKRAGRLNRALSSRKNVFLVLDGVSKYIDLEKLGNPLSVDGCGLLVTACTLELCLRIGCQKLIEMGTLNKDEGLSLFGQVLGGSMNLTPSMQQIAKSMVVVCGGLPLGIIAIAGSMRGETDTETWEDALDELRKHVMGKSDTEGEFMKALLYFCFDRLGRGEEKINNGFSRLQLCFLYCSLYPEDFTINGDELIRKFILEELLYNKIESRKYLFELGYTILNELVNSGLLESASHGQVKMHSLMRAMAIQVAKKKLGWHQSATDSLIDKEWPENLEKKSLSYNGVTEIPSRMSPNCPNLSTLLLDSNPLTVIPEPFFQHFDGLRVLDLSRTFIKTLPESLSELQGLKALILTECHKLVHVPYVGKLKKLKEFDLTLTAIEELPQGMEELINLRFLSLDKAYQLGMLPRGLLPELQMLQCLYLPYHVHVQGEEVATLEHLEEFRGRVNDASELFQLIKSREGNLDYSIEVRSGFKRYKVDEFRGYNQLILSKYNFGKARDEDVATLLEGIVRHLTLRACEGQSTCLVEDLSRINDPSSLESLEVDKCEEIECLLRRERMMELGAESKLALSLPSAFLSLKNLEIFHCNNINRLGLLPSQLSNLERMTIAYCKEVEDIMEVDEDKEAASVVSLPKLNCLLLEDLPRLKSICNATTVCKSLEILSFWGCPKLKKLPLIFGPSDSDSPPSTLKSICISKYEIEWWKELELDHHLLDPFVTF